MTTEIRIIKNGRQRRNTTGDHPSSHRGRLSFELNSRCAVMSIVHIPHQSRRQAPPTVKNVPIERRQKSRDELPTRRIQNHLASQRLAVPGGRGGSSTTTKTTCQNRP